MTDKDGGDMPFYHIIVFFIYYSKRFINEGVIPEHDQFIGR